MLPRHVVVACALAGVILGGLDARVAGQARSPALDDALARFWQANDPTAAGLAAQQVLSAGRPYTDIHARLKAGRSYLAGRFGDLTSPPLSFSPAAAISRARMNIRGLWHPYVYVVPPGYDPTRRYPVRFYLQGDTTQPASSAESGVRWLNYEALERDDSIVVFPGAWNGFPWWGASQVEHMAAVLDELKRSYNVDENRVYLLGSSDGGTGVDHHVMVAPTPWAAFLPFNADPAVLAQPPSGVDAQMLRIQSRGQGAARDPWRARSNLPGCGGHVVAAPVRTRRRTGDLQAEGAVWPRDPLVVR